MKQRKLIAARVAKTAAASFQELLKNWTDDRAKDTRSQDWDEVTKNKALDSDQDVLESYKHIYAPPQEIKDQSNPGRAAKKK